MCSPGIFGAGIFRNSHASKFGSAAAGQLGRHLNNYLARYQFDGFDQRLQVVEGKGLGLGIEGFQKFQRGPHPQVPQAGPQLVRGGVQVL